MDKIIEKLKAANISEEDLKTIKEAFDTEVKKRVVTQWFYRLLVPVLWSHSFAWRPKAEKEFGTFWPFWGPDCF